MTGREVVSFVEREHPQWLAWVAASCKAQRTKAAGVPITAWDVAHAAQQPIKPLGPLVRWEILEHVGESSRRGHRRLYLVRDGVCDALAETRLTA